MEAWLATLQKEAKTIRAVDVIDRLRIYKGGKSVFSWDTGCGLAGTGKKISAVVNKRPASRRQNLLGSIFSGSVLCFHGAQAGARAGS